MIHLDLSQLLADPRSTGIQRAERELILHWPGPAPLIPCQFEGGALRELPPSLLDALREPPAPGGVKAERARLAPHVRPGRPVQLAGLRLLNAELFVDPRRAALHRHLASLPGVETFWLIYDFLPWMHPDWFGPTAARQLMPYLQAVRSTNHLAFISETTRRDFQHRVMRRTLPGPVIPMGSDGLALERQSWAHPRPSIVMLGTIEPRKNAAPAMRAFQQLWRAGTDIDLVMIGHVGDDSAQERALLDELATEPRFHHLEGLPDEGVRHALRQARALLFPSEGEGYGIPPMEALHAGIPVIVAASLPALEGLPSHGQIRLDTINPDTIAAAILALGDARSLAAATTNLTLPTWRDFSQAIARWTQTAPPTPK